VDADVSPAPLVASAVVETPSIHKRALQFPTWPQSVGPTWEPLPGRGWQTGERNPDGTSVRT
jgi:hypothetical protein